MWCCFDKGNFVKFDEISLFINDKECFWLLFFITNKIIFQESFFFIIFKISNKSGYKNIIVMQRERKIIVHIRKFKFVLLLEMERSFHSLEHYLSAIIISTGGEAAITTETGFLGE